MSTKRKQKKATPTIVYEVQRKVKGKPKWFGIGKLDTLENARMAEVATLLYFGHWKTRIVKRTITDEVVE